MFRLFCFCFFFSSRRRHTRCSRDWSSDVCSSDLSLEDPLTTHDCNVNATLRLLVASTDAGVRRVVYSSSSSAYGDTPTLPKVESAEPLPRSPYAAAKLAGEQYVLAFARASRFEAI